MGLLSCRIWGAVWGKLMSLCYEILIVVYPPTVEYCNLEHGAVKLCFENQYPPNERKQQSH